MHILIVAYYGEQCGASAPPVVPAEDLDLVSDRRNVIGAGIQGLIEAGATATSFPFRCHSNESSEVVDALVAAVSDAHADVVLWWDYSSVTPANFAAIKQRTPGVLHAVYNFDPTRNAWPLPADRASWYDVAFVSDADEPVYTCPTYTLYPPVLSATQFRPLPHAAARPPTFDVFYAQTNFYEGLPNQLFSRRETVNDLTAAFGDRFAYFGPLSPDVVATAAAAASGSAPPQRRTVSYADIPWLAASSAVCLCLHGDCTVRGYLNERAVLLACCGANVLMDSPLGAQELFGDTVTFLTPGTSVSEQVRRLLAEPQEVREARRARLRALAVELFDAACWGETIVAGATCALKPCASAEPASSDAAV